MPRPNGFLFIISPLQIEIKEQITDGLIARSPVLAGGAHMLHKIALLTSFLFIALLSPTARSQQPASQPQQGLPPAVNPQAATPPGSASRMRLPGADADLSYRIGPGDILDIGRFGRPELA